MNSMLFGGLVEFVLCIPANFEHFDVFVSIAVVLRFLTKSVEKRSFFSEIVLESTVANLCLHIQSDECFRESRYPSQSLGVVLKDKFTGGKVVGFVGIAEMGIEYLMPMKLGCISGYTSTIVGNGKKPFTGLEILDACPLDILRMVIYLTGTVVCISMHRRNDEAGGEMRNGLFGSLLKCASNIIPY